jgi:hypothetical protein
VAVNYLLRILSHRVELIVPGSAGLMSLLTGKGSAAEALSVVLSNIGAFVPAGDGTLNADASLAVVQQGLSTYVEGRLQEELLPLIDQATAGQPELRVYLDEVLLATLKTMTGTVLGELRAVQAGGTLERALREMCSALLMRLFGRSLVVAADVLLTHSLGALQGQFRTWARHANDAGGAVPVLAGLTGLQRDLVNDLVVETLEVCAETFAPLTPQRRAHVRDLMYQMIDTMPPDAGVEALESLKAAGMVGNAEAAFELAQLLGEEIASNLLRFIQALLAHAAQALLALLADIIEDIQGAIEVWIEGLKALARDLVNALAKLRDEIARLEAQIDDAVDGVFAHLSTLLGGFAGHSGSRSTVRTRIKDAFKSRALEALSNVPGYGLLPADVRRGIRSTVRSIVDDVLDADVFDAVVDALQRVAGETAEFFDDVRAIEPGDDLTAAIADLALDRIEAGVRAAFNGKPYIRISFDAPIIGRVDLGKIEIPMATFIGAVRSVIRDLSRFDDALQNAAAAIENLLSLEADHVAASRERDALQALKDESDDLVAESAAPANLQILSPQSGAQVSSALKVRLRLSGSSESVLRSAGLSQRRLYVWINGAELDIGTARVKPVQAREVSTPVIPAAAGGATAPLDGRPTVLPATARLQRQVRDKRLSVDARLERLPGAVTNAGGRLSMATFGATLAGPEPPTTLLDFEIDVPDALVHQGINTVACALLPGPRQRRVERAVSFLATPPRKSPRGRPVMPEIRKSVELNADLRAVLEARGVQEPDRVKLRNAFKTVASAQWSLPRSSLQKSVSESRKTVTQQIESSANRLRDLHRSATEGKLRPPKLQATDRKESSPDREKEAR